MLHPKSSMRVVCVILLLVNDVTHQSENTDETSGGRVLDCFEFRSWISLPFWSQECNPLVEACWPRYLWSPGPLDSFQDWSLAGGGGGQRNPLLVSFPLCLKCLLRSILLVMAGRSLLPTEVELATLATVEQVRVWAGLDNGVWQRASEFLGTLPSLRVLSLVPLATLREMPTRLRLPQPAVSGVEQPHLDHWQQLRSFRWRSCGG